MTCSGFVRSIGRATIFPCSYSPELHLLSSTCESWADFVDDIGGDSNRSVGGALVFGAGGGGSLLLDFSALPRDMSFSMPRHVLEVGFLLVRAFSLYLSLLSAAFLAFL